jgi:hypothetical protein
MDTGQGVETGLVLLGQAHAEWGGATSGTWTGGTVIMNCEEAWDNGGACFAVVDGRADDNICDSWRNA